MVAIRGVIGDYKFGSFEDAIKRISSWIDQDLITEKQMMEFIYDLFHQIPEDIYNDISDRK